MLLCPEVNAKFGFYAGYALIQHEKFIARRAIQRQIVNTVSKPLYLLSELRLNAVNPASELGFHLLKSLINFFKTLIHASKPFRY